ncbi:MAG: AAA family ATPase [Candidatus Omnitrophota bacterium]|nr:AAA family ATPase [Candidatus Omnitrophota bacterium]
MYKRFYGFKENPFTITPDSDFFYPSEQHQSALDALTYAIKQRKGFVVVTGPIGCGKTTVTRTLLRNLSGKIKTAVITNTHLSPKGIITMILEDLGVAYRDGSKDRLLIQLNKYLVQQVLEGHNVVLIIDEAQNLSPACLEEVRMLSNLETEKEKLIQIVLIGQPELRRKLEAVNLEQLRQRVAIHYHITPLSFEETKKYIQHRLNRANANGRDLSVLFDEDVCGRIFEYSQGIPRMINVLCDHALLTGFVRESESINREIIDEAIYEIRFQGEDAYEQVH